MVERDAGNLFVAGNDIHPERQIGRHNIHRLDGDRSGTHRLRTCMLLG